MSVQCYWKVINHRNIHPSSPKNWSIVLTQSDNHHPITSIVPSSWLHSNCHHIPFKYTLRKKNIAPNTNKSIGCANARGHWRDWEGRCGGYVTSLLLLLLLLWVILVEDQTIHQPPLLFFSTPLTYKSPIPFTASLSIIHRWRESIK